MVVTRLCILVAPTAVGRFGFARTTATASSRGITAGQPSVLSPASVPGPHFPLDLCREVRIGPPDLAGPQCRTEVRRAMDLPPFKEQQIRPGPGVTYIPQGQRDSPGHGLFQKVIHFPS